MSLTTFAQRFVKKNPPGYYIRDNNKVIVSGPHDYETAKKAHDPSKHHITHKSDGGQWSHVDDLGKPSKPYQKNTIGSATRQSMDVGAANMIPGLSVTTLGNLAGGALALATGAGPVAAAAMTMGGGFAVKTGMAAKYWKDKWKNDISPKMEASHIMSFKEYLQEERR